MKALILATLYIYPMLTFASIHKELSDDFCGVKISNEMPKKVELNVKSAIKFLKRIKGKKNRSSRLHRKILKGRVLGDTYCSFISKRIKEINYSESRKMSIVNWGGYVALGDVVIGMHYATLATLLLHEASHTNLDEDGYRHAYCPNNFKEERNAGKLNCDRRAASPYGLQYVFSGNLKKFCLNCTQVELDEVSKIGKQGYSRIISHRARWKLYKDLNY
jgi:hypothetical protein